MRQILFPRDIFLVGKRTICKLDKKGLLINIELYFEKSDLFFHGQFIGERVIMTSEDKTMFLGISKIISPEGYKTHYREYEDGKFKAISEESAEKIIRTFEKEFQEKYEIIITGEETDELICQKIDSAKWQYF